MPTHKLATVNPREGCPQRHLDILTEHGPQFRIPENVDEYIQLGPAVWVPVCALRDNWVGFLNLRHVTISV